LLCGAWWCTDGVCVSSNYFPTENEDEHEQEGEDEDEKERRSRKAEQAYANPKSQINILRAMHADPRALETWADAGRVAEVMYQIMESGDVPLRVPLGADSWALQREGLRGDLEELEKWKDVAVGVSRNAEEMLRGLEALKV
jgi:hypothetical protein